MLLLYCGVGYLVFVDLDFVWFRCMVLVDLRLVFSGQLWLVVASCVWFGGCLMVVGCV